jgi:hypothetical protein
MMPLYRVTLNRWHPLPDGTNPFKIRDVFRKRPCTERVWEFEAADEDEVRRYYDDAKKQGIPDVIGFDLARIEQISARSSTTQG